MVLFVRLIISLGVFVFMQESHKILCVVLKYLLKELFWSNTFGWWISKSWKNIPTIRVIRRSLFIYMIDTCVAINRAHFRSHHRSDVWPRTAHSHKINLKDMETKNTKQKIKWNKIKIFKTKNKTWLDFNFIILFWKSSTRVKAK